MFGLLRSTLEQAREQTGVNTSAQQQKLEKVERQLKLDRESDRTPRVAPEPKPPMAHIGYSCARQCRAWVRRLVYAGSRGSTYLKSHQADLTGGELASSVLRECKSPAYTDHSEPVVLQPALLGSSAPGSHCIHTAFTLEPLSPASLTVSL